jgi:hypothetical protein
MRNPQLLFGNMLGSCNRNDESECHNLGCKQRGGNATLLFGDGEREE